MIAILTRSINERLGKMALSEMQRAANHQSQGTINIAQFMLSIV
jgi:hypothetical protein